MRELDIFVASLTEFWTDFVVFMPRLLAALVILFFGWVLAKLLRAGMLRLLRIVQFQRLAEKSGLEAFLEQGNVNMTLSRLVSDIIYWLVLLIVIVSVSRYLGLEVVARLFTRVINYVPNILAAILVLVFGALIARFINRLLFAYLNRLKVENALTISTIAEYAVQVFVIFVALEQLQIGTALLISAFQIGFGAVALAFAIAFGLGGKERANEIIARMSRRKNDRTPPPT